MSKTKEEPTQTGLAVIQADRYLCLSPEGKENTDVIFQNIGGDSISEFDLDQIKVPGSGGTKWAVPGVAGEESVDEIVGIICYVAKRRQYWSSQDPSGEPPDCYSKDMVRGIGEPGGACDECPLNEFGSGKNDTGKACKEKRLLFMVRESDLMPIVVGAPPGSLKAIKQYLMRLRVPYWQAVTSLKLQKTKNSANIAYAEIVPSLVGTLPPESRDRIKAYAENLSKAFA